MIKPALNFIGSIPDVILRNIPDISRKPGTVGYDEYLGRLQFYFPENWKGEAFLHLPDSAPEITELFARPFSDGVTSLLDYPSRYEPRNPALVDEFRKFEANSKAYLQLWRHDKNGTRPIVLCVHGFMMGRPSRGMRMFRIRKMFDEGLDVAFYVQPHHWKRSDKPPMQHLLCPENIPLTIETFGQNVHDLHSSVLMLESMGYEKIGIIGASLGGFTSALYATMDASVDFMFMAVPALNFDRYLDPKRGKFAFRPDHKIKSATAEALKTISPVNYKPAFDVEKICVVIHSGDKLAEVGAAREWIRRWAIPNCVEVTGGHWLYMDKNLRGKTWYEWLEKMRFLKR